MMINSTLTDLNVAWILSNTNPIHFYAINEMCISSGNDFNNETMEISQALMVNSSLTSLDLHCVANLKKKKKRKRA